MRPPRSNFDQCLRRLPDLLLLALGLAILAGITAFRLTAGRDIPVVDFMLIAVVGVGWYAVSRWCGYAVAVIAAAVSVAIAVGQSHAPVRAAVASGVARLALYFVVLSLLGLMRRERAAHQNAAATDQQTGAVNARTFQRLAQAEVDRSQRYQHELSLAYLDVDDFKAINDRLGHIEGDHVLAQVSHVMRTSVRSVDAVARMGGDEFAILMPETNAASARAVVDRVRSQVARLGTTDAVPVSCSIGLVTFDRPPASLEELIDAADELMYRAKQCGKDRIEAAERSGSYEGWTTGAQMPLGRSAHSER